MYLNINFNQFNIFFKYYGYDTINNSNYLNYGNGAQNSNMKNEYGLSDAFNIYITNAANGSGPAAIAGYYYPFVTFDDYWFVKPWTLCHEVGHSLGLLHTFYYSGTCEHATRNNLDPNFNATLYGDQIVDTHATGNINSVFFDNNCNYLGGAIDCQGTQILPATVNGYYISGPPINNFMTTESEDVLCQPYFTPGQGERMRNAFIIAPDHYQYIFNSIESLYEPFYQNVFAGQIVSSDDDPDSGGVNVCRKIKVKLRFQPGLYTEFSDTDNGTIIQTVYQQFNYDDELDHSVGVRIPILDDSQTIKTVPVSSLLPFFCSFEPYTSGTLLSTEILGSMNITIKELDEIQVKDPKLYDSLMEKYYYILKQRTESGIEKEKVFYKP